MTNVVDWPAEGPKPCFGVGWTIYYIVARVFGQAENDANRGSALFMQCTTGSEEMDSAQHGAN